MRIADAYIDVRGLLLDWKDAVGEKQRAPIQSHVDKLVTNFSSEIKRVARERRLFVSITREHLQKCVEYSANRLNKTPEEVWKVITDYELCATWDEPEQPQVLLLAPEDDDRSEASPRVEARVQAGQHRVLALKQIAEAAPEPVRNSTAYDILSDDAELRRGVQQVRPHGKNAGCY